MATAPESYTIVLRPVLTEKSTGEQERLNVYRFEVAAGANRVEIAKAVEDLFEVKVAKVNTMIRPGKIRRRGPRTYHQSATKIAMVQLHEGEKIELL